MSKEEQKHFLSKADPDELKRLNEDWLCLARPKQIPPPHYSTWLFLGGRSSGKTRCAIEEIVYRAIKFPGDYLIAGRTSDETKQNQLLPIAKLLQSRGWDLTGRGQDENRYDQREGVIRLLNGSTIYSASGQNIQDAVRGKNLSMCWLDELASFDDPEEALFQARYAVRKGEAKIIITTTPSARVSKLLRKIQAEKTTITTSSSAYENLPNLAEGFIETLINEEGTTRCEAEVWAALIDYDGVYFKHEYFQHFDRVPALDKFTSIIIGYDPAISSTGNAHGIIVMGCKPALRKHSFEGDWVEEKFDDYFVLADRTLKGSPEQAVKAIVDAFHEFDADQIVCEVNNGGDWIPSLINTVDKRAADRVIKVNARKGKHIRSEIAVNLYEKRRVQHFHKLAELERELIQFSPERNKTYSPDRCDALIWCFHAFDTHRPQAAFTMRLDMPGVYF